jgi:trk system potassium uptake protein TrkH
MINMLTSGAFFMIAVAMVMGGSAGSTSGGIKALRVGLIAKGIVAKIKGMLAPESAHITTSYQHVGKRLLSNDILSASMVITALYVISYLIGTLIGIAYGYEAIPATFESISAASNAGLSAGVATPDAPILLKIVYILQMWMGRLEFLTLLALFASMIVSLKPRRKVHQ